MSLCEGLAQCLRAPCPDPENPDGGLTKRFLKEDEEDEEDEDDILMGRVILGSKEMGFSRRRHFQFLLAVDLYENWDKETDSLRIQCLNEE